jgi:hypothetical protein
MAGGCAWIGAVVYPELHGNEFAFVPAACTQRHRSTDFAAYSD